MANLIVINPPFIFEDSLSELNKIFKPVEKFEVIYHSETLSKSTHHCFNLIGSICGYISARNKTDAMIERFAIIEEALRKGLQEYKIKIDETVKNVKANIDRELEIFKKQVDKIIFNIKKEYREKRLQIREKIRMKEYNKKVKEEFLNIYLQIKEVIKIAIESFKDISSDFVEYTRLNDEYLEMERNYINLIKM
ncbi:hypothetical protein [uncultured Fusobacterium sp.]|uniref:hypothetical protein n=1 Tax=uncultured Fusobacterium sp. TaxID=159267 RepID=UPI00265FAE9A|nr:hypothetical protein [uncultured Fusobacterium sp.]